MTVQISIFKRSRRVQEKEGKNYLDFPNEGNKSGKEVKRKVEKGEKSGEKQ